MDGIDELIQLLNNSSDNAQNEFEKVINITGNKLLRKVKLKTPVAAENGGTLRRSWQSNKKSNLEFEVYNNMEYAAHVEFGHRTRQGTGASKLPKYKYKPKPGGIKFIPGVFMLKKSVDEVEKSLIEEVGITIDKLWK